MSYKRWTFVAIFLFGIGLALGSVPLFNVADVMSQDLIALQELANRLATLPQFVIFAIIFIKNALTVMLSFALSPILCLMPILSLVLNGVILGFVSVTVAEQESVGFVVAGLLPHGIFEIPALIISQTAGLSFGAMAIQALFQKRKRSLLVPNLRQNFRYLLIALALLLPAAIIETYITPLLIT